MEGKGSVQVMQHQLTVPEKKARFEHLQNDGKWIERDDVWIDYLGNNGRRSGKLTIGYGRSKADDFELIGPELGFGWAVGDRLDEPVLIIKTAWGGKSLDRDFRPPSRGYPDSIKQVLENEQKKKPETSMEEIEATYGHFYREMINEIQLVTSDLKTYVPDYNDQGFEICGFVWFQGWNDQYAPTSVEDYADNMAAFIEDVRKDLNVPELPFVIGAMGHNGTNQSGKILQIADAQASVAERPEFAGRVVTIRTAQYWDVEAEEAYKKYWEDEPNRDMDKWRQFGNDRGYHYFGSPVFFYNIGKAFGETMLDLIKE
jgi:alpha-galactosidase